MEDNGKRYRFAHKRASFKRHVYAFFIINIAMWAIMLLDKDKSNDTNMIWMTSGWTIGLFFHFWGTYFGNNDFFHKKEYEQLTREYLKDKDNIT